MTQDEKKQALDSYLNEYRDAIHKLIDNGKDEDLHPVELIYGVASTGLLTAQLQAKGLTETEIVDKLKELNNELVNQINNTSDKKAVTVDTSELVDSVAQNVRKKNETLH